jgi:hypothetical protein
MPAQTRVMPAQSRAMPAGSRVMPAPTYISRIGPDDVDVDVDIPEVRTLYVEISTGCVGRDGLPRLRDDFTKFVKAMGAG